MSITDYHYYSNKALTYVMYSIMKLIYLYSYISKAAFFFISFVTVGHDLIRLKGYFSIVSLYIFVLATGHSYLTYKPIISGM